MSTHSGRGGAREPGVAGMAGSAVPPLSSVLAANTVLYCRRWCETVAFYERGMGLARTFASDWFVEFQLAPGARLSVADERRATVKSAGGAGLTLSLQVADVQRCHAGLVARGLALPPVGRRPWGAEGFLLHDPEGTRIEVWAPAHS